jgi:uncharacterized protein YdhG (YjbR/CyaY superfamily)
MPKIVYKDFEEYLEDQNESCKAALRELRKYILEVIPDSEELINYNIPAFTLIPGGKREQQIMIAGYKNHIGLYPHPTTMEYFEPDLFPYKRRKGSVQFPLRENLPKELIIRMIQYRLSISTN